MCVASAQRYARGGVFKQFDCEVIVSIAEREQCRQPGAELSRRLSCRVDDNCMPSSAFSRTPSKRPLTTSDECKHRREHR